MSDQPVRRVARFVRNHPWAILPEKFDAISEVIDTRMRGVMLSEQEIQARVGALGGKREAAIVNAVAVIPLCGVMAQKMNMFTQISGGTSTEQFITQVKQAVADPGVNAIVIDCDSPGGTVDGIIEAADALYALKGKGSKPIVAVANPCMASAAYWLLSQCDEVIASPSAQVGSIGVFTVHEDVSAANEKMGFKPTYISAGQYKVEANPDQPLSAEAKAFIQQQVNERYSDFLSAVARGRRMSAADVKTNFGQGRVFLAKDALAAKMVDRIATLDETVSRMMQTNSTRSPFGATSDRTDGLALKAAAASLGAEVMAPNADGTCADNYELGDDGMCHLVRQAGEREEGPDDEYEAAVRDEHAILSALIR